MLKKIIGFIRRWIDALRLTAIIANATIEDLRRVKESIERLIQTRVNEQTALEKYLPEFEKEINKHGFTKEEIIEALKNKRK